MSNVLLQAKSTVEEAPAKPSLAKTLAVEALAAVALLTGGAADATKPAPVTPTAPAAAPGASITQNPSLTQNGILQLMARLNFNPNNTNSFSPTLGYNPANTNNLLAQGGTAQSAADAKASASNNLQYFSAANLAAMPINPGHCNFVFGFQASKIAEAGAFTIGVPRMKCHTMFAGVSMLVAGLSSDNEDASSITGMGVGMVRNSSDEAEAAAATYVKNAKLCESTQMNAVLASDPTLEKKHCDLATRAPRTETHFVPVLVPAPYASVTPTEAGTDAPAAQGRKHVYRAPTRKDTPSAAAMTGEFAIHAEGGCVPGQTVTVSTSCKVRAATPQPAR